MTSQLNRSRLMKRAHSAYRTRKARFLSGKTKTRPTFSSSLKWSWKIEKEEMSSRTAKAAQPFKAWTPGNGKMFRFYFGDGQYVQVNAKSSMKYDGDHCLERIRNGWYKLVGVSAETFESNRIAFEDYAKVETLRPSKF